jgi:hypothetical protein
MAGSFYLSFKAPKPERKAQTEEALADRLCGLFGQHRLTMGDERRSYLWDEDSAKYVLGSSNNFWLHPLGDGHYRVVARYLSTRSLELYRQVLEDEYITDKSFLGSSMSEPALV